MDTWVSESNYASLLSIVIIRCRQRSSIHPSELVCYADTNLLLPAQSRCFGRTRKIHRKRHAFRAFVACPSSNLRKKPQNARPSTCIYCIECSVLRLVHPSFRTMLNRPIPDLLVISAHPGARIIRPWIPIVEREAEGEDIRITLAHDKLPQRIDTVIQMPRDIRMLQM